VVFHGDYGTTNVNDWEFSTIWIAREAAVAKDADAVVAGVQFQNTASWSFHADNGRWRKCRMIRPNRPSDRLVAVPSVVNNVDGEAKIVQSRKSRQDFFFRWWWHDSFLGVVGRGNYSMPRGPLKSVGIRRRSKR